MEFLRAKYRRDLYSRFEASTGDDGRLINFLLVYNCVLKSNYNVTFDIFSLPRSAQVNFLVEILNYISEELGKITSSDYENKKLYNHIFSDLIIINCTKLLSLKTLLFDDATSEVSL